MLKFARGAFIIIIALSYDSSPKVVFIRHSGFPDSNLQRVCLENLSKTIYITNCRQYCFSLQGLISAVLMSGMEVKLKKPP